MGNGTHRGDYHAGLTRKIEAVLMNTVLDTESEQVKDIAMTLFAKCLESIDYSTCDVRPDAKNVTMFVEHIRDAARSMKAQGLTWG